MEHDDSLKWYQFRDTLGRCKSMNLRQRKTIMEYMNVDSPGYGSMAKSYKITHPNVTTRSAEILGSRYNQNPMVQNAIETLLERSEFGLNHRIEILASIGRGDSVYTKQEVTKDGDIVEVEVRPSYGERLKSIELANKVDGTYAKVEATKELALDEAKRLKAKLVNELSNEKGKKIK